MWEHHMVNSPWVVYSLNGAAAVLENLPNKGYCGTLWVMRKNRAKTSVKSRLTGLDLLEKEERKKERKKVCNKKLKRRSASGNESETDDSCHVPSCVIQQSHGEFQVKVIQNWEVQNSLNSRVADSASPLLLHSGPSQVISLCKRIK